MMQVLKTTLLSIGHFCMITMHPALSIGYLKDCPEYVELCAQWSFSEWGKHTPNRTFDDYIASRMEHLNNDTLPLTMIAFLDAIPVGMCSLAATRGILSELSPWLASLYVDPVYRNQGIGKALEHAICAKARDMNFKRIYCFTSQEAVVPWYTKLGWQCYGHDSIHHHQVTVLEKTL